jgi:SSS family solute:Na+ symporter
MTAAASHFVFNVTDDVLYGIDTPRYPDENPHAHELSRRGYPWFGDEMELLINATNRWPRQSRSCRQWLLVADGLQSDQIAQRRHRHRRLLEGEPRTSATAWHTIRTGFLAARRRQQA